MNVTWPNQTASNRLASLLPSDRTERRDLFGAGLVAIVARLLFWVVTDRVWEDALITVTHARNAVAGIGLTHHPGEPMTLGFSSGVAVLVPLAGEAVVVGSGILVLRLVSLGAVLGALLFAQRICRHLGLGRWPTLLVLGYLALDQNHIFYGMAGMETQLAVAILLWSIDAVIRGRTGEIGVSFGLALLVRPDFILWLAAAGLDLLVRGPLRAIRAGLVALVVVSPWLVFTTLYYGSPIPQTIVAKTAAFTSFPAEQTPATLVTWCLGQFTEHAGVLLRTFMPYLENTMTIDSPMPIVIAALIGAAMWGLLICGAALALVRPGGIALATFAFASVVYRTLFLPRGYFDWYVPPWTAVGVLLVAVSIDRGATLPWKREWRTPIAAVASMAVLLPFAIHFPSTLAVERAVQVDVETAVRTATARYLGEAVPTGEAVVSESAGYFGYYSGVKLWDFPGLTSPAALKAVKELPESERELVGLIDRMRPPWIVVRPFELDRLRERYPSTAAEYELAASFGQPMDHISAGGITLTTIDTAFLVMRQTP